MKPGILLETISARWFVERWRRRNSEYSCGGSGWHKFDEGEVIDSNGFCAVIAAGGASCGNGPM